MRVSVRRAALALTAAAVNPVDTQIRAGPSGFASLPYIPGFDVSGVVAEVGDGVTGRAIGDSVFALLDLRRGGGYAEYAIVKPSEVAAKPARASHAEAASLPLVALTAWQALFVTADDVVLDPIGGETQLRFLRTSRWTATPSMGSSGVTRREGLG